MNYLKIKNDTKPKNAFDSIKKYNNDDSGRNKPF